MKTNRLVASILTSVVTTVFAASDVQILGQGIEHPDGTGWQRARAIGTKVEVLLPCPYQDVAGNDNGIAIHVVGCAFSPRTKLTVSELTYASPEVATQWFERQRARPGVQPVAKPPPGYGGRRTLEDSPTGFAVRRWVLADSRLIILVAEWEPDAATKVKPMVPKFLGKQPAKAC